MTARQIYLVVAAVLTTLIMAACGSGRQGAAPSAGAVVTTRPVSVNAYACHIALAAASNLTHALRSHDLAEIARTGKAEGTTLSSLSYYLEYRTRVSPMVLEDFGAVAGNIGAVGEMARSIEISRSAAADYGAGPALSYSALDPYVQQFTNDLQSLKAVCATATSPPRVSATKPSGISNPDCPGNGACPPTGTGPQAAMSCTASALTRAVGAKQQLSGWIATWYACGSGWAVAAGMMPSVGFGVTVLHQTWNGWQSHGLDDGSYLATVPGQSCGGLPRKSGLPPYPLLISLVRRAGLLISGCSVEPPPA